MEATVTLDEAAILVDVMEKRMEKRIVIDTSTFDGLSLEELIAWMLDDCRTGLDLYIGWLKAAALMTNPNGTCNGVKSHVFGDAGLGVKVAMAVSQASKMVADEQRRKMK